MADPIPVLIVIYKFKAVNWELNFFLLKNAKMMPGVVGVVVVVPSPIVSVIVFRLHWVHGFGVVVVTKLIICVDARSTLEIIQNLQLFFELLK